jgi:hypothetical protein
VTVPWRWVCWSAGAALLVLAGTVLMLQVQVRSAGTTAQSCGSAWDVIAGRVGWQQWWSADLSGPGGGLSRTLRCPDAVNGRIVLAGGLTLGAVAAVSAGEIATWRRSRQIRRDAPDAVRRLRLLGTVLTVLGGLLTAGGLAGIALVVADPQAPLFFYASRPIVVLIGLLLVLPAILLIALGRTASVMAEHLAAAEVAREAP